MSSWDQLPASTALTILISQVCHQLHAMILVIIVHNPCSFPGIRVILKCNKVKNHSVSYTEKDGSFEAKLPSDENLKEGSPSNCTAWIAGGPQQLYVSAEDSAVLVVEAGGQLTTSKPLGFYKTRSVEGKDMMFGSSKTLDLPMPREWGLTPSSYYIPFFPIIGIP